VRVRIHKLEVEHQNGSGLKLIDVDYRNRVSNMEFDHLNPL